MGSPVSWCCRIHQLLLCRGVRPPSHKECPNYDTKKSNGEVPIMLGALGNAEYSSSAITPSLLWPGVVAPDRVLFMGQIELNYVLMRNWVAWNRTVFIFKLRTSFKLHTCAKRNYLKWNCFHMLNWIVLSGTVFNIETVLIPNWIVWNITVFI